MNRSVLTTDGRTHVLASEHRYCDTKRDRVLHFDSANLLAWDSRVAYTYDYVGQSNTSRGIWEVTAIGDNQGQIHGLLRQSLGTQNYPPIVGTYIWRDTVAWNASVGAFNDIAIQANQGNSSGAAYSDLRQFSLAVDEGRNSLYFLGRDYAWYATRYNVVAATGNIGTRAWSPAGVVYSRYTGTIDKIAIGGIDQSILGTMGVQAWIDRSNCRLYIRELLSSGWDTNTIEVNPGYGACNSNPSDYIDSDVQVVFRQGVPIIVARMRPSSSNTTTGYLITKSGGSWSAVMLAVPNKDNSWGKVFVTTSSLMLAYPSSSGKDIRLRNLETAEDILVYSTTGTIGQIDLERSLPSVIVWTEVQGSTDYLFAARVCEYLLPVPVLEQPEDGSLVDTCAPTLQWSVPGIIDGYEFHVFVNGVPVGKTASTTFTLPAGTPLGDSNSWYVKAVGCPGAEAVSATGRFRVDAVAIPAPGAPSLVAQGDFDCETAGARTFSWSGVEEGVLYDLVLNGQRVRTDLTGPSVTLPAGFGYKQTNNWQVAARNCAHETLSAVGSFNVTSSTVPQTPTITAPAHNSTVYCDPTIAWTYPTATTGILFDIVRTTGQTLLASGIQCAASPCSWTPVGDQRLANGSYSYRVLARNCAGETAQSGARAFTVNNTPIAPVLSSPSEGQATSGTPNFIWTVTGDQKPDVRYSVFVDDETIAVASGLTATSFTVPVGSELPEGEHHLQVVAYGCMNTPAESGWRRFVADTTGPQGVLLLAPPDSSWFDASVASVNLSWAEATDVPAGVGNYDVFVDGNLQGTVGVGNTVLGVPTSTAAEVTTHDFDTSSNGWNLAGYWKRTSAAAYSGWYSIGGNDFSVSTSSASLGSKASSARAVSYRYRVVNSDSIDRVYFQASSDGVNWQTLATHGSSNTSWSLATIPLSGFSGMVWLRFYFSNNDSQTQLDFYFDDFTYESKAAWIMGEGVHPWFVTARDAVGNVTDSETWSFGIDRTDPSPFLLVAPAHNAATQEAMPTFSWNAATDAVSGIDHYELVIDGAKSGDDIPSGILSAQPPTVMTEGTHQWRVIAVDRAGNRRASTDVRSLVVDRTPPASATLISVTPQGSGDWVSSNIPTFRFTATDNVFGSGISHFLLFIDGVPDLGNPIPNGSGFCEPDTCRNSFDILEEGEHSWHVVAFDRVGLSIQSASGRFVVESQPPLNFNHASPANGVTVQTFYPLLCWNRSTDAGSGLKEYRVNIRKAGAPDVNLVVAEDGGIGEACVRSNTELTNGSYTWLVTAVDHAGNTRDANNGVRWTMTIERDVTPPTSAVTQPASDGGLAGCQSFEFKGTASDPGPTPTAPPGSGVVKVEVQLDGTSPAGWEVATLGGRSSDRVRPWTWTKSIATTGMHSLYVRATDAEGNVQATPAVRTFNIDCSGPVPFGLTSPSNEAFVGACATFTWEATTDSPAGMDRYELRIQPSVGGNPLVLNTALNTSRTLTGSECLTHGTYTWRVTAFDTLGNATDSNQTRTVYVDTEGPVSFPLTGQTTQKAPNWVCNGRRVTVTWSPTADLGSGMSVNPYQVFLNGSPAGARTSQTSHDFTNLADGAYTWTVRAYDALGNWTEATPSGYGSFQVDCTGPGLTAVGSFRLYANHIPSHPLDTGIDVSAGDPIRVWASGQLCFADDASCDPSWGNQGGCMGPEGQWTFPNWVYSTKYYANLAFGRVLGLVGGNIGSPIDIGSGATFTAPFTGRLRLATNDDDRYNCASRWHQVTVQAGPGFNLLFPANGAVSDVVRPILEWSPVTDAGIGVKRIEVLVNGQVVTLGGGLPPGATSYALPDQAELVERDNTWQVRAYDDLDNASSSPVWTIRTDLTPPAPFDVSAPLEGVVVGTKTPDLCWQATSDSRSQMAHYLVFVDDQYSTAQYPNQTCQQPRQALEEGRRCFHVIAQDELRHERRSTNERCFIVDTLPPDPFSLATPAPGTTSYTAMPEFCWETATDSGTGVKRYEVWLSGNHVATVQQPDVFPMPEEVCWKATSVLPNGEYVWFVKAFDGAGRATTTETWNIRIERDVTPPSVAISIPAPGELYGTFVEVLGTADDGPKGTGVAEVEVFEPSAPDSAVNASFDPATGTFSVLWLFTADGSKTLCAQGLDREGNRNPASGPNAYPCVTFVTDVSPPLPFQVLSPSGNAWVGARPTFTWQATSDSPAGVARYYLQIEGQTETDAGTATTFELTDSQALGDGEYTWTARAVDRMGNSRPASNSHSFRVDGLKPKQVSLLSPPDGAWSKVARPELCWNPVTDNGASGIATYRVRVGGQEGQVGAPQTCFTPGANLPEDSHSWDVAAIDRAGNVGPVSAGRVVRVDVTAPPVPVPTYPHDGMRVRTNPPVFSWQMVQDLPAGKASGVCGYTVTLNGIPQQAGPEANSLTWGTTVTDGEMTWTVRAFDCAGNQGTASAARKLYLDTVPPSTVNFTAPAEGAWLVDPRPVVRWTAATDDASGICAYRLKIDGGDEIELDKDNLSWAPPADLPDGLHVAQVSAVDCAGNPGSPRVRTFGTDVTPPGAIALVWPGDGTCVNMGKPEFRWEPCSDAASGVDFASLVVDSSEAARVTVPGASSAIPLSVLSEGIHAWSVTCTDKVGLSAASDERTVRVDLTAPAAAIVEVTEAAQGFTVYGSASDVGCGLDRVEVRVGSGSWGTADLAPTTGAWSWTWTPAPAGVHLLRARAVDLAGNTSSEFTVTVTTGACWQVGQCDAVSRACSIPVAGRSCDDGSACTLDDTCLDSGACQGTQITCDDDNLCTTDTCNPATGCVFTNNTLPCDDGNACTGGDVCGGGTCAGTAIVCNDNNPCTTDTCNPATGCVFTNNTLPCDDGNPCTANDACDGAGGCAGTAYQCPAAVQCEASVTCDGMGGCVTMFEEPGTSCNDGDPCTHPDVCNGAGGCAGTPKPCIAGACHVSATCDGSGGCHFVPRDEGTVCDDGDSCTFDDECDAEGTCTGILHECPEPAQCESSVACDGEGGCTVRVEPEGNPCDDGDPCTRDDECNGAGVCQGILDRSCQPDHVEPMPDQTKDTGPGAEALPEVVEVVPETAMPDTASDSAGESSSGTDTAVGTDATVGSDTSGSKGGGGGGCAASGGGTSWPLALGPFLLLLILWRWRIKVESSAPHERA